MSTHPGTAPDTAPVLLVDMRAQGSHADAIARHAEALPEIEIVSSGGPPAAVAIVDHATPPLFDGPPALLFVTGEVSPLEAAQAAVTHRPAALLRWPDERDRLTARLTTVSDTGGPTVGAPELRVGGAAGGVGTSTVALALAGVAAWGGRRTLVVAAGRLPAPTGTAVAPRDLTGHRTWAAGEPLPGVPDLRLVRTTAPCPSRPVTAPRVDLVVRDVGVAQNCDVLVLRRDRAGLDALAEAVCAVAVVLDAGAAPRRAVLAAAGGRPLVTVPVSARVARAGYHRRVPAGLPGRWLVRLRSVLAGPAPGRSRPAVHRKADTGVTDHRPAP